MNKPEPKTREDAFFAYMIEQLEQINNNLDKLVNGETPEMVVNASEVKPKVKRTRKKKEV